MANPRIKIPLLLYPYLPIIYIGIGMFCLYCILQTILFRPSHDFIYTTGGTFNTPVYTVQDGKITEIRAFQLDKENPFRVFPTLLRYHIQTHKNEVLTLDQAQKWPLSPENMSPDGYKIVCSKKTNYFYLFSNAGLLECKDRFLEKFSFKRKLRIANDENPFEEDFRFIGWVMEQ